jgi:hypothetical protein
MGDKKVGNPRLLQPSRPAINHFVLGQTQRHKSGNTFRYGQISKTPFPIGVIRKYGIYKRSQAV